MTWRKTVFFLLVAFCLTPYALPPLAFAAGLIFAAVFGNPYPNRSEKYGKIIFKISVVLFGFGLNFLYFVNFTKLGYLYLIAWVVATLLFGFLFIKFLKTKRKTYLLASAAIAVSGENTISAISPAIHIEENDSNAAFSTIFLINLTAIFLFPIAGYFLNLSIYQYAVWTAVAIPDTLFALNAATLFGEIPLSAASLINLLRLLFLIPVAHFLVYFYKEKTPDKPVIPWFLFLFFVPIAVRRFLPDIIPPSFYESFVNLAKAGFTITIFLTGSVFSRQTFKNVGIKPLIFGFLLWSLLAIVLLIAVIRWV